MNKKFGNAILMIVLLMYSGNISAMSADQQLGGFQVEMGTGENTELPWDWDEAAGNPGVQEEPQEEIWEDAEPQEEEGERQEESRIRFRKIQGTFMRRKMKYQEMPVFLRKHSGLAEKRKTPGKLS